MKKLLNIVIVLTAFFSTKNYSSGNFQSKNE
jgi:hypothetical protein